jgi:hypothetical protein
MATMSVRGLDDQALAQLKDRAQREGTSLNSLVLQLLQGTPKSNPSGGLKTFSDLDALAGTWGAEDVTTFERHTAAFAEVDAALWQ